jgi:hypothetical protein
VDQLSTQDLRDSAGEKPFLESQLSDFFWGERAWQNVPEPNTGEKLEFRAVFESQESVASTRQEVWNGRIESKAQTLLIVNPKLQTPQDYLWNACPGQALKMMKDDPGLINKKSGDDECTPLHHAARFGHKDVVIWLIEHGAEVNAAAYNGFTPLHLAERKEIAEILIKKIHGGRRPYNLLQRTGSRRWLKPYSTLVTNWIFPPRCSSTGGAKRLRC